MEIKQSKTKFAFLIVLSSVVLLGIGIVGMQTLASMKTPPAKKPTNEKTLRVEVLKAELESVTPFITGFGEVKAVNVVPISAAIQGKVTEIHPLLEVGELVKKEEILIKIDTSEEELSLESNQKRLSAQKRILELTRNEFQRLEKLYKKNRLVTVSEVEAAEQAYHTSFDTFSQLEYAIASLQLKIDRGSISAPFDGRIKSVSVEKGQFVTPGTTMVTLVNDSVLEVIVSIDSERAEKILRFKKDTRANNQFWFSELEQIPVRVSWSQGAAKSDVWGILHRVLSFDPRYRTLKLAVRLTAKRDSQPSVFPIVEGMFCRVKIPGYTLQNVIKLPRQAVQYDETVYIVSNNRLKTVPVEIGWIEDKSAYVAAGLQQEDYVVLTRLSNPLENTLVEFNEQKLIASKNIDGLQ